MGLLRKYKECFMIFFGARRMGVAIENGLRGIIFVYGWKEGRSGTPKPRGNTIISFMKFFWKLLKGISLWADFFRRKYLADKHLATILHSNYGSRFWRSLLHVASLVLKHAKMVMRNGEASFWFDNWLRLGPLSEEYQYGDQKIQVKDLLSDTG